MHAVARATARVKGGGVFMGVSRKKHKEGGGQHTFPAKSEKSFFLSVHLISPPICAIIRLPNHSALPGGLVERQIKMYL